MKRIEPKMLDATDELRKLILENPDLPLLISAGEDSRGFMCTYVNCRIGEFLDCEQEIDDERCYDDREEFTEALIDYYYDDCIDMSDEEQDEFINKKLAEYEPYWTKCIILHVDN